MGKKFLRLLVFIVAGIFSAGVLAPAYGAVEKTDPLAGNHDVYIRDSLLGLFLPFGGGTSMKSIFAAFDPKSPDQEVSNADLKFQAGLGFSVANDINVTGLPAALGKIRNDGGCLYFGLADYGNKGLFLRRGEIDLNGAIKAPPAVIFKVTNTSDYRATDLVMCDVNGDGIEDYIVGEVKYNEKKKQVAYVRIIDGKSTESSSVSEIHQLGELGGQTPFVKLDIGDFKSNGQKQLAVAFSNIKRGDAQGDYEIRVFDMNLDLTLSTTYYQDIVAHFHEDTDALDLAVGDFNGDDKDDIIVASDHYKSGNHKYHFKLYTWSGSAWGSSTCEKDPATARNDYDGAVVSAFDLDRDGRDELVWIMPDSSGMFTIGLVKVKDGKPAVIYHDNFSVGYKEHSQPRHLSMVAGSFFGRNNISAPGVRAGEVVVLRHDWDAGSDNMMTVFDVEGKGDNLKLAKRGENGIWTGTNKCTPVLLAGNIKGESLRLSNAEMVEETDSWVLNNVIQMPPKHVDYIPVPWDESGIFVPAAYQQWRQLEGTMYEDFYGEISQTQSGSQTHTTSQKVDWGLTGGVHANINTQLQADFAANAGGDFVENSLSESQKKVESFSVSRAEFQDQLSYNILSRATWRYEVTGEKYLSGDRYVPLYYEIAYPGEKASPGTSVAGEVDFYRPIHEPFNVLSYPSKPEFTLDYDGSAVLSNRVTYSSNVELENASTWSASHVTEEGVVNNVNFDATLTAGIALGNTDKGVVSILTGSGKGTNRDDAKLILEGTFGGHYFQETASTLSTAWAKSATLKYHAGSTVQQAKNKEKYKYDISYEALRLPSGVLMAANAVSLGATGSGARQTLWDHADSVYRRLPDLALNLPRKFTTQGLDLENAFVNVIPQSEPVTALWMQGLRILNSSGSEYPLTPGLIPRDCEVPTIEFPIYNYSTGKDIAGFSVRVMLILWDVSHFVFPENAASSDVVFDKTFRVEETIPYHQAGKRNWLFFRAPLDVKQIAPENYMLLVELDPDNAIEETHKKWNYAVLNPTGEKYIVNTSGDCGGNNLGYTPVAIADVLSEYPNASFGAASLLPEGHLTVKAEIAPVKLQAGIQVQPDLSREAIRQAIENKTDIPLKLELWYEEGPDFIPGFALAAFTTPDDGSARQVIAMRSVPGMKKGRVYVIDASLRRMLLLGMAEKKGRIEFQAMNATVPIDVENLKLSLIYADGDPRPDDSGGSGCDAAGGILMFMLLPVFAVLGRRYSASRQG